MKKYGKSFFSGMAFLRAWPIKATPLTMTRLGLCLAFLMAYVVFDFIVKEDYSDELDVVLVEKTSLRVENEASLPPIKTTYYLNPQKEFKKVAYQRP